MKILRIWEDFIFIFSGVIFDVLVQNPRHFVNLLTKLIATKLIDSAQVHDWVTGFGCYPLISEEENCKSGLVEVTDAEVEESVQSVPKLDTLILVKVSRKQKHKGGGWEGTGLATNSIFLCFLFVKIH